MKRIYIMGGGITGLIAAIQCETMGISVTVFERQSYEFNANAPEDRELFKTSFERVVGLLKEAYIQKLDAVTRKNNPLTFESATFGGLKKAVYDIAKLLNIDIQQKKLINLTDHKLVFEDTSGERSTINLTRSKELMIVDATGNARVGMHFVNGLPNGPYFELDDIEVHNTIKNYCYVRVELPLEQIAILRNADRSLDDLARVQVVESFYSPHDEGQLFTFPRCFIKSSGNKIGFDISIPSNFQPTRQTELLRITLQSQGIPDPSFLTEPSFHYHEIKPILVKSSIVKRERFDMVLLGDAQLGSDFRLNMLDNVFNRVDAFVRSIQVNYKNKSFSLREREFKNRIAPLYSTYKEELEKIYIKEQDELLRIRDTEYSRYKRVVQLVDDDFKKQLQKTINELERTNEAMTLFNSAILRIKFLKEKPIDSGVYVEKTREDLIKALSIAPPNRLEAELIRTEVSRIAKSYDAGLSLFKEEPPETRDVFMEKTVELLNLGFPTSYTDKKLKYYQELIKYAEENKNYDRAINFVDKMLFLMKPMLLTHKKNKILEIEGLKIKLKLLKLEETAKKEAEYKRIQSNNILPVNMSIDLKKEYETIINEIEKYQKDSGCFPSEFMPLLNGLGGIEKLFGLQKTMELKFNEIAVQPMSQTTSSLNKGFDAMNRVFIASDGSLMTIWAAIALALTQKKVSLYILPPTHMEPAQLSSEAFELLKRELNATVVFKTSDSSGDMTLDTQNIEHIQYLLLGMAKLLNIDVVRCEEFLGAENNHYKFLKEKDITITYDANQSLILDATGRQRSLICHANATNGDAVFQFDHYVNHHLKYRGSACLELSVEELKKLEETCTLIDIERLRGIENLHALGLEGFTVPYLRVSLVKNSPPTVYCIFDIPPNLETKYFKDWLVEILYLSYGQKIEFLPGGEFRKFVWDPVIVKNIAHRGDRYVLLPIGASQFDSDEDYSTIFIKSIERFKALMSSIRSQKDRPHLFDIDVNAYHEIVNPMFIEYETKLKSAAEKKMARMLTATTTLLPYYKKVLDECKDDSVLKERLTASIRVLQACMDADSAATAAFDAHRALFKNETQRREVFSHKEISNDIIEPIKQILQAYQQMPATCILEKENIIRKMVEIANNFLYGIEQVGTDGKEKEEDFIKVTLDLLNETFPTSKLNQRFDCYRKLKNFAFDRNEFDNAMQWVNDAAAMIKSAAIDEVEKYRFKIDTSSWTQLILIEKFNQAVDKNTDANTLAEGILRIRRMYAELVIFTFGSVNLPVKEALNRLETKLNLSLTETPSLFFGKPAIKSAAKQVAKASITKTAMQTRSQADRKSKETKSVQQDEIAERNALKRRIFELATVVASEQKKYESYELLKLFDKTFNPIQQVTQKDHVAYKNYKEVTEITEYLLKTLEAKSNEIEKSVKKLDNENSVFFEAITALNNDTLEDLNTAKAKFNELDKKWLEYKQSFQSLHALATEVPERITKKLESLHRAKAAVDNRLQASMVTTTTSTMSVATTTVATTTAAIPMSTPIAPTKRALEAPVIVKKASVPSTSVAIQVVHYSKKKPPIHHNQPLLFGKSIIDKTSPHIIIANICELVRKTHESVKGIKAINFEPPKAGEEYDLARLEAALFHFDLAYKISKILVDVWTLFAKLGGLEHSNHFERMRYMLAHFGDTLSTEVLINIVLELQNNQFKQLCDASPAEIAKKSPAELLALFPTQKVLENLYDFHHQTVKQLDLTDNLSGFKKALTIFQKLGKPITAAHDFIGQEDRHNALSILTGILGNHLNAIHPNKNVSREQKQLWDDLTVGKNQEILSNIVKKRNKVFHRVNPISRLELHQVNQDLQGLKITCDIVQPTKIRLGSTMG